MAVAIGLAELAELELALLRRWRALPLLVRPFNSGDVGTAVARVAKGLPLPE